MFARTFLLTLLAALLASGSQGGIRRRAVAPPGPPGEWELVPGIPQAQSLACTPAAAFVGTAASGIYTVDEANAASSKAGMANASITGLTVAPTGAIFAATSADGIYRSTNDAETWQRLANAPRTVNVMLGTPDMFYAGGCDGLFASSNQGDDWVRTDNGLPPCVTALAARSSHLYAGTKNGLFRSVSGGASWLPVTGVPGGEIHALVADPLGRLFVATHDAGIFRSTDGASWNSVTSALPMNDVRALFVTDPGEIYAGTERGAVFRSADRGATWSPVYPGLRGSRVAGFCATNTGLFVAGGGALLRTDADFRLFGLNFGPYKGSQDPNLGATVTDAQITDLLQVIRANTWWIRTFESSTDLMHSGSLAHAQGLKAAIGAWLGRGAAANEVQIQNLIAAGRAGDADLLIVGSEVLLRNDLSELQLISQINRVRQAVPGVPVAYADTYVQWLAHPNVVDAVDVVLVNYYPYWEGIKIDAAVGAIHAWHRDVVAAAKGRPVIVSETGWPSAGNTVGDAVPSLENASRFFLNFVSWARATHTPYFHFEAFDEPWKSKYEGPQGAHWGVWDEQGRLKSGMSLTLGGATVPDNWSSSELVGGPGNPSIEFTFVPMYGRFDELRGRVLHVNPYLYKVLVYIYISSWWVKPYADRPLTTIAKDGTWNCDITTGGIDERSVKIAAFLVRSSYQPPILLGASSIPSSVYAQAADSVEVTRTPP